MMFVEDELFDALPANVRVKRATAFEEPISRSVQKYTGIVLKESSPFEDKVQKTDRWWVTSVGKWLRVAIKIRTSGFDALVDVSEPFLGWSDPGTKLARDMLYDYALYICLIANEVQILKGPRVHQICLDMMEENRQLPLEEQVGPKCEWVVSKKHGDPNPEKACKLNYHIDRDTGKPKVLAYIPISYMEKTKSVQTVKYDK